MNTLNFAEVRSNFNRAWHAEQKRYIDAGMSETDINEMLILFKEQFNSDRRFYGHSQSIQGATFSEEEPASEDNSPLLKKHLERFSTRQPAISEWGRTDWIEDLDTPELVERIRKLSAENVELLTAMIADDKSRAEFAREIGVSRAAITKRLDTIKKILLGG